MKLKTQLALNFMCYGLGVALAAHKSSLFFLLGVAVLILNSVAMAATVDQYFRRPGVSQDQELPTKEEVSGNHE